MSHVHRTGSWRRQKSDLGYETKPVQAKLGYLKVRFLTLAVILQGHFRPLDVCDSRPLWPSGIRRGLLAGISGSNPTRGINACLL
jgi:hypothetical protein